MIEQAAGGNLRSVAWPGDPSGGAQLMKPHGSAGGDLIVTAEQVLHGLGARWLERLRADVAGRTVIFLGYRGRDLDFQPVWNSVLDASARVVWFERWAHGGPGEAGYGPVEERYKRSLLRSVDERAALTFPSPAPFPSGIRGDAAPNPSWDFVAWCRGNQLADVPADLVSQLFEKPAQPSYPPLPGKLDWAKPALQGLLGDYRGAQKSYFFLAVHPGNQRKAVAALATLFVNQGGISAARTLGLAAVRPIGSGG